MATAPLAARATTTDTDTRTTFLVVDTESVPDGDLLSRVKYDGKLTPDEAIAQAQKDQLELTEGRSDFIPVSFHYPIAICVLRVGADFRLQNLACLDAPQFRPRQVVEKFWNGVRHYKARLVTFNGRGFDLPLLELAAFRYGIAARDYCQSSRNRFGNGSLDLLDWMSNFGASRISGGLDLLAKMIGKPGKMDVSGDRVLEMYREQRLAEINDYCLCDTLDTYFVFLRTRIFTGDITAEQEARLVAEAHELLEQRAEDSPALQKYLNHWHESSLRISGPQAA
jgi:hypothetical protein